MKPVTTYQIITPEMASDFLSQNQGNRAIRRSWVMELARRMSEGEWEITHQGIAFDTLGNLVDGQHRLHAIVLSGASVTMAVTSGIAPKGAIGLPIDEGVKRSISDQLGIPKGITTAATFLTRIAVLQRCGPIVVRAILDVFQPTLEEMLATCGTVRRNLSVAPVRAAVCLRSHQQGNDNATTLAQYRNLVLLDFDSMMPSVKILTRQLYEAMQGSAEQYQIFARTYLAFDPARYYASRITIRDSAVVIDESRKYIQRETGIGGQ